MILVLPVTPSCHASYKQDHQVRILPFCKARELKLALTERWRNLRPIANRLIIHIWKYRSVLAVLGISASTQRRQVRLNVVVWNTEETCH